MTRTRCARHLPAARQFQQPDQFDVLPINSSSCAPATPGCGAQTSDVPYVVIDNGSQTQWMESLYLQDEWKALSAVTVNYGLRLDHYNAYSSGGQLSPRVNVVWQVLADTTVHAGYSRYFTPPPFELVGGETFTKFANSSALPPGSVTADSAPSASAPTTTTWACSRSCWDG